MLTNFNGKIVEKKLIKTIASSLLLFFLTSFSTDGGLRFNSERLSNVFRLLKADYRQTIESKSSSKPGSFFFNAVVNGNKCKIVFRINKYKELDHLGIYLINDSIDVPEIREVYDYLEREFLVSALLGDKYPLESEAKSKKVEVLFNGGKLKNDQKPFNFSKILIDHNTPMRIKYDAGFFSVEWSLLTANKFSVLIPNNYSVITEKTKDELENDLLRELRYPLPGKIVSARPDKKNLKSYNSDIYLLEGEASTLSSGFSSSKYFVIGDSIYPVFNRKYSRESASNFFLNMIPTLAILDMTQILYGGKRAKFKININSFYSNFTRDFVVYFGWHNTDRENIKASIVFCNTLYNYNHLLIVSGSTNAVFEKNGEITCLFYAYIPKENLNKNIF